MRRCDSDQVYALRRLVRGLGSGRQAARQGFATTLALLLGQQQVGSAACKGGSAADYC